MKYVDYLDANHEHVASYQEFTDEPQYPQTITELLFDPEAKYTICREEKCLESDTRASRMERFLRSNLH